MKPIHRLLALAFVLAAGCARPNMAVSPAASNVASTTEAALRATIAGWDRGDVNAFLAAYSDTATYVGQRGIIRGKPAIVAEYSGGFFSRGVPATALTFDEIEVRTLGNGHALMLGRYTLTPRAAGARASTGRFSLVWALERDGWKIIHDHSS